MDVFNILEELRIILFYSFFATLPILILKYFHLDQSAVFPLFEILLCCYITYLEDDVLLEISAPDLSLRAITSLLAYFAAGYGALELANQAGQSNGLELEFNSSDSWTTWLIVCSVEYLRMAAMITYYRNCVIGVIFVLYTFVYLFSTYDT